MTAKRKRLSGQALEGRHRVNRMDAAGRGVVEVDEHTVLVPGAARGETIRLQLIHRGRHGVHHARLTDLVEASPARVDSPCPHFLDCGGCDLLHLHPDEQRRWKREVVARALNLQPAQVSPVQHAGFDCDYRALAKFVVGERGVLGSYRRHSHQVARMDECVVHAPAIAAAHGLVQAQLQSGAPSGIRYVVMRASIAEERVIITLVCTNPRAGVYRNFAHSLGKATFVAAVDFHHNDSEGSAIFGSGSVDRLYDDGKELRETVGSLSLQLKSNAFSQVNPAAASLLYEAICKELDGHQSGTDEMLDLYAGSGGIGLSYLLSNPQATVRAIESNAGAADAARHSAQDHGLSSRYTAVNSDVLSYLKAQTDSPSAHVVNPPRKGLGSEVIKELGRLRPELLVYVSCNPKSLAKDASLLEDHGYRADRWIPFDLFPNTSHVETLAVYRRAAI